MAKAALAGDADEARRLDAELASLHAAMFVQPNPIPAKWALQQMGLIDGGIRLPMIPLEVDFHATVRAALQRSGVMAQAR